ncbi:hypothetical protein [Verrucomicrobium spinosum]|uniref:hypothetical protein n=1 Tax=Verrucomicrobium spinosum TaxID=2736 RepID=UPI001C4821CA|nr:hypothetical protein [Verrucomicrobium spinosum]
MANEAWKASNPNPTMLDPILLPAPGVPAGETSHPVVEPRGSTVRQSSEYDAPPVLPRIKINPK